MKIRGQKILDPKKRIESFIRVNEVTGCWEWMGGGRRGSTYGRLVVGSRANGTRRTISAHRYSYETFVGPIPDGLWVLHKCDNPPCVNPDHLFLGDRIGNCRDRDAKGRNKAPPVMSGENATNVKLTWKLVDEIRRAAASGESQAAIGRRYGVARRTVGDVISKRSWKSRPAAPAPGQKQRGERKDG